MKDDTEPGFGLEGRGACGSSSPRSGHDREGLDGDHIDTAGSDITGADALQQPVGRVGKPEDIAEMVMFLCSDKSGFITGENICIDGGMTKQMIYYGEHGWTYGGKDNA